jgi:hypothetical protein
VLEIRTQIPEQQAAEIECQEHHRSYVALKRKGKGIECDGIEKQMPDVCMHETGRDQSCVFGPAHQPIRAKHRAYDELRRDKQARQAYQAGEN